MSTMVASSVLAGKCAILDETFGAFRLMIDAGGHAGLGTTAPLDRFHLEGSDANLGIRFANSGAGGRQYRFVTTSTGSSAGAGKFAVLDETAGLFRLVVDSSGNVGVGTASPATMLHVTGEVTVDGNIAAKYQDGAVCGNVDGEAKAGTALINESRASGRVTTSTEP